MKSYRMKTYRLHNIGLFSTFRFGVVVGFILSFLPVLLATVLLFWGANVLADWIAGLRATLPFPGPLDIPVDTVELLGLGRLLQTLEGLARMASWQVALLGLALWMGAAFLTGLLVWLVALVFNVISAAAGGIELVLDEGDVSQLPPTADSTDAGSREPL